MTQKAVPQPNDIKFTDIVKILWQQKIIVILITMSAAVLSVYYALSIPNTYRSTVLLAPVDDQSNGMLAKLSSQFGGLAAMAGVNVGNKATDKPALAIEIIKSRLFISEFVNKYNLKPTLMGVEGWDMHSNKLIYNDKVYDAKSDKWVREVDLPLKPEPSDIEVHEFFKNSMLNIEKDKKAGLYWISVTHVSPYVAKDLVDKIVIEINEKTKQDDINDAETRIEYLTSVLQDTGVSAMKKIFYELIEQQEQTKMLAKTQKEYVFKTVDPAVVAEVKDGPKRPLICVLGTILGFIFGVVFAFAIHYVNLYRQQKNESIQSAASML